jgi:hypothetical protein
MSKYYYGNSYKEAISNSPIEINSAQQLEDYEDNYNFVIPVSGVEEDERLENIKIEGRIGTWYEIDREDVLSLTYILFESEDFGDEAGHLVVEHTKERNSEGEIPEKYEICETFDDLVTTLEEYDLL